MEGMDYQIENCEHHLEEGLEHLKEGLEHQIPFHITKWPNPRPLAPLAQSAAADGTLLLHCVASALRMRSNVTVAEKMTVCLQTNVEQSWNLARDILVGEASFTSSQ